MLNMILHAYNSLLLIFFALLNGVYLFLLLLSYYEMRKQKRIMSMETHTNLSRSLVVPGITIIVPAYNEEATITESVTALLHLDYPVFEVVVVNDGATDHTLDRLIRTFALKQVDKIYRTSILTKPIKAAYCSSRHHNLIIIDKENGGKADALNCGINLSNHPYLCAVDSDALIEKDALLRMMRSIQEYPDEIIAAGGIVRIVNGCTINNGRVSDIRLPGKPLVIFQIIEYLRSFLAGRTGFSTLNGLLIISGAFGIFRKDAVKEAGGYRTDTVGEDMELVVRLHQCMRANKRIYRIVYVNDPVCWTEAPESYRILARQRNRWQRGLIETIAHHYTMFLNPRYGIIGFISLPFFIFGEMLSPLIEFTGLITTVLCVLFGLVSYTYATAFLILTFGFGIFLSWSSILLEELTFHKYTKGKDLAVLLFFSIIEPFGYRQLNAWWRLKGTVDIIRKKKGWGTMTRKGFGASTTTEPGIERIMGHG